ncbi:MAG TPA: hypothetical protein VKT29_01320 [Terriglobales bacterium]|nr:hypothetical protein [Terriglobales bacterium]
MSSYDKVSKDEENRQRELMLDKTLADSFPASDPPSSDPNPRCEDLEPAA